MNPHHTNMHQIRGIKGMMVWPVLEIWRDWYTPSLLLLQGPLWPGTVVSETVRFMGQIDLFINYLYCREILAVKLFVLRIVIKSCNLLLINNHLKPLVTVQTNEYNQIITWNPIIIFYLLVLDKNTWYHITVCQNSWEQLYRKT